jgi:hypothetical protein
MNHVTRFEARYDDGSIDIRVQAGTFTGYYRLSNELMNEIRVSLKDDTIQELADLLRMATKLYATGPMMPPKFAEESTFVKKVNEVLGRINEAGVPSE